MFYDDDDNRLISWRAHLHSTMTQTTRARCIWSGKSEEHNKGQEGEKWLEVNSVAATVQKPQNRWNGWQWTHMSNRYGQEAQVSTVINTHQDTYHGYLWAFVMTTGAEGLKFICPHGWLVSAKWDRADRRDSDTKRHVKSELFSLSHIPSCISASCATSSPKTKTKYHFLKPAFPLLLKF